MRVLIIISFGIFLLAAPNLSHASSHTASGGVENILNVPAKVVGAAATIVQENPGKSVGVAGCIALIIFPPAAALCAATIVVGATYDGDTQKILKMAK
jgi:hypothetical protein